MTGVYGTYSGDGVHVESATRTDRLLKNTCTTSSPGTTASQPASIGQSTFTNFLPLAGQTLCPAGTATSTAASSCTTLARNQASTLEVIVELSGWTDASIVTFKVRYVPLAIPGCNYASVLWSGPNEWGMQASTTVSQFRSGLPFSLRFAGARMLTAPQKTSEVSWDYTMNIQPL